MPENNQRGPTGVELIAMERKRQIEQKGYGPEHDAGHVGGEMAQVACYFAHPNEGLAGQCFPNHWAARHRKRNCKSRFRGLVIAGALIAAELDRLLARGPDQESEG